MIRKKAELTKLQIVHDASAKSETGFPLNDCLENGPQNKLWDVLVSSRFHPVILCADIEEVHLQTRLRESGKDCLKSDWVEATYNDNDKIEIYRFARLAFWLKQPPFILEGTLDAHFYNCGQEF